MLTSVEIPGISTIEGETLKGEYVSGVFVNTGETFDYVPLQNFCGAFKG